MGRRSVASHPLYWRTVCRGDGRGPAASSMTVGSLLSGGSARLPEVRFEIDSCVVPACACDGDRLVWLTVTRPMVWRDESGRLLRNGDRPLRTAVCSGGTRYRIGDDFVEDAVE